MTGVFERRYFSTAQRILWSEPAKLARWLEVELAFATSAAKHGFAPPCLAVELSSVDLDPEIVADFEEETRHDVAAFLRAVEEGLESPEAKRHLHRGLTSSDVVDTANSLALRESAKLVLEASRKTVALLRAYGIGMRVGRTHGVPAEPVRDASLWNSSAAELERAADRLSVEIKSMPGKLSGVAGAFVPLDVERDALSQLGLYKPPQCTQVVPRDLFISICQTFAFVATACERAAINLRLLVMTGESFVLHKNDDQIGSTAMPHKRNPIMAERTCGLAAIVRSLSALSSSSGSLWMERDLSHSVVDRLVFPTCGALAEAACLSLYEALMQIQPDHQQRARLLYIHEDNLNSSRALFEANGDGSWSETHKRCR